MVAVVDLLHRKSTNNYRLLCHAAAEVGAEAGAAAAAVAVPVAAAAAAGADTFHWSTDDNFELHHSIGLDEGPYCEL